MINKILRIYKIFLEYYGFQGWWPLSGLNKPVSKDDKDWMNYVEFTGSDGSAEDFKENWPRHLGISPLSEREKFEIIMGAILTQNTSWTNVERVLYNLNKHGINTIDKIKNTGREEFSIFIRSAGYHNQKSGRLKDLASYFSTNYKNLSTCLNKLPEELRKELLSLKGIGPETADSIVLYSAQLPVFVIDAYTRRIFTRILGKEFEKKNYDRWQNIFMQNLAGQEDKVKIFKEYHGLIVKHGKEFCRSKPLCEECFVKPLCRMASVKPS